MRGWFSKGAAVLASAAFFSACAWAQGDSEKGETVIIKTNRGDMEVKLFTDVAPKACENFKALAEKGYYDGLIFHRVIKGFMIQGGDPTGTGGGGASAWGEPFEDEVSAGVVFDRPGLLAMANSGPDSNGSQFFITVAPTPWLNMKHTIFGEVVGGYDVAEKIASSPTGAEDRPREDQKILRVVVK